MGTIGWDIAWANDGFCIVEGNTHYDSTYVQAEAFGPITSEDIAHGLKKRSFFNKWDKTKMHPHYKRYHISA